MRKILAVLLTLALMLGTVGAFAAEVNKYGYAEEDLGSPRTDLTIEDYIDSWTAIYCDQLFLGLEENEWHSLELDIDGETVSVVLNDEGGETSFETTLGFDENGSIFFVDTNADLLTFHLYDTDALVQIMDEDEIGHRHILQRSWVADVTFALAEGIEELDDEQEEALAEIAEVVNTLSLMLDSITEEDIDAFISTIEEIAEFVDFVTSLTEEDIAAIFAAIEEISLQELAAYADEIYSVVMELPVEEQDTFFDGLEVLAGIYNLFA